MKVDCNSAGKVCNMFQMRNVYNNNNNNNFLMSCCYKHVNMSFVSEQHCSGIEEQHPHDDMFGINMFFLQNETKSDNYQRRVQL